MNRYRGFLLQPTYRIESGRPVVHLYGTLESGESFLIRDTRWTPHFYIPWSAREAARRHGASVAEADPGRRDLRGTRLARVDVAVPPDTPAIRDRLIAAGIPCHEADVRFAYRYLIDRRIRGSLGIIGTPEPGMGVDRVFLDPETEPDRWAPTLRVLSIDIETDPKAERLLSIALVGCGISEVLLFTPPGFGCPPDAIPFSTEKVLLAAFLERVQDLDPDVLTGWNVIDFDLTVLGRLAGKLGVPFVLGRDPGTPVRFRTSGFGGAAAQVTVTGRVVLDGIQLLRGAFIRFESYALQAVSQEVLGRGKTFEERDGGARILEAFQRDREAFVTYNRNDAELVLEILDAYDLIPLTVERSLLTGMPPDRVSASIAAFDFLYLSELTARGIAGPTVSGPVNAEVGSAGGHVLEASPGLHRLVAAFDFKSLYPSVIRTFQIDPLGYLPEPGPEDDPIRAPSGAAFRREPGILPRLLDDLMPRREEAKRAGNAVASQAIKILMNSFYGVLGTSACRFADPALSNAITSFGKEMLLWSKRWMEGRGFRVLYGDTDSLFVEIGAGETGAGAEARAGERARSLVAELNRDLGGYIAERWRVESRLELEFERLYLRLFLPPVRGGTVGARKRYAGLVRDGERERVVFTGMEVVRRDWTDLARTVQRELYERLFTDRAVDAYLEETVRSLRAGELDSRLVYRKALRKAAEAYTATTPPHVAAARKTGAKPGTVVEYLVAVSGPEPVENPHPAIDYEHYVQKQVRPVAEPVLEILGLEFSRVIGDNRQTELF